MKRGIKHDFTLLAIQLIPVGVAINVVGYQLSTILKLPLFLDQIGTTLVAIIAGPWVGVVAGGLSNIVNGMLNPVAIAFFPVSMSVGLITGFLSRWKFYTNIFGIIFAFFAHNIIPSFVGSISTIFVFGGVTGTGLDFITGAILASGKELFYSVFSSNLLSGILTSGVTIAISLLIIKSIPPRFLTKMKYGYPYIRKGAVSRSPKGGLQT